MQTNKVVSLKVIKGLKANHERNILAEIHRKGVVFKTRHYAKIDNALPRILKFMMQEGQVGDVCDVSHKVSGLTIGTVKLTLKGKLQINYIWDEK